MSSPNYQQILDQPPRPEIGGLVASCEEPRWHVALHPSNREIWRASVTGILAREAELRSARWEALWRLHGLEVPPVGDWGAEPHASLLRALAAGFRAFGPPTFGRGAEPVISPEKSAIVAIAISVFRAGWVKVVMDRDGKVRDVREGETLVEYLTEYLGLPFGHCPSSNALRQFAA